MSCDIWFQRYPPPTLNSQPNQELWQMYWLPIWISCVFHSLATIQMERLGKMQSNTFWRHSGNQMCMRVQPLSKYKWQFLHTSWCLTKLSLLKSVWHCQEGRCDKIEMIKHRKKDGGVQTVLDLNLKTLEQWLSIGPIGHEKSLTQKWAWEEEEPMSQCLPGQEMKIQKLIHSFWVKNLLTSLSETKPSTSRSPSTTYSVQGDY